MIRKFENYITEKYHVDQNVRHLTNIIYNKINYFLPKLILNKRIEIKNLLQDNYKKISFTNDTIEIKLGKKHGAINTPILVNNSINNLRITLTIDLSKDEIKNKYLINNKIKETINHECQHIIEFFYTNGNLTSTWSFHNRLNKHNLKFKDYPKWMDITYMFYKTEEHEIRSSISQVLEYLKNNDANNSNKESLIKKSDVYIEYEYMSKISGEIILDKMKNTYPNFEFVLKDFVSNVLLNNTDDLDGVFTKQISILKHKSSRVIKKMLRVTNNISESIDVDVDYSEYIETIDFIRDKKINTIFYK